MSDEMENDKSDENADEDEKGVKIVQEHFFVKSVLAMIRKLSVLFLSLVQNVDVEPVDIFQRIHGDETQQIESFIGEQRSPTKLKHHNCFDSSELSENNSDEKGKPPRNSDYPTQIKNDLRREYFGC